MNTIIAIVNILTQLNLTKRHKPDTLLHPPLLTTGFRGQNGLKMNKCTLKNSHIII